MDKTTVSITLLDIFSTIFLAVNILWTVFHTIQTRHFESEQKYVPILVDKIFKPFYKNIECNLFIPITIDNWESIKRNLIVLHSELSHDNLLFYIPDNLLIELETLIQLSSNELKKVNKHYQNFSYFYFRELNRIRKITGLHRRSLDFRVHHGLFYRKFSYWFIKNGATIFLVLVMVLLIFRTIYPFIPIIFNK